MPSVSQKQARTMAAAAHDPAFARKVGIPANVAQDFNRADTGSALLSRAMRHRADGGDADGPADEVIGQTDDYRHRIADSGIMNQPRPANTGDPVVNTPPRLPPVPLRLARPHRQDGGIGTPLDLGPIFASAGQEYGIDPLVLQAIHMTETGGTGRWDQVSPAGALGGMQLMPSTARSLGVQNPFDPSQAIPGAAKGLSQLLQWSEKRTGGPGWPALDMALKAYNNGPNPARWNNPETAGYPGKVLQYYQQLQAQHTPPIPSEPSADVSTAAFKPDTAGPSNPTPEVIQEAPPPPPPPEPPPEVIGDEEFAMGGSIHLGGGGGGIGSVHMAHIGGGSGLGKGIPQVAKPMSLGMAAPFWERSESHQMTAPMHSGFGRGHFAQGGISMGMADPYWTRSEARQINDIPFHSGMIPGSGFGRTDQIPLAVGAESHIIPADAVSGAGQGSSAAGSRAWMAAIHTGPWGVKPPAEIKGHGPPRPPAAPHIGSSSAPSFGGFDNTTTTTTAGYAEGGSGRKTSILAASGELVVPPEYVQELGERGIRQGMGKRGESAMDCGHRLIDEGIANVRNFNIKWLKRAPPPKK